MTEPKDWPELGSSAGLAGISEDLVSHPRHYVVACPAKRHGGGRCVVDVECIDVNKALGYEGDALLWNAFKYLWRANFKGNRTENIRKAHFYLTRWIFDNVTEIATETIGDGVTISET